MAICENAALKRTQNIAYIVDSTLYIWYYICVYTTLYIEYYI